MQSTDLKKNSNFKLHTVKLMLSGRTAGQGGVITAQSAKFRLMCLLLQYT